MTFSVLNHAGKGVWKKKGAVPVLSATCFITLCNLCGRYCILCFVSFTVVHAGTEDAGMESSLTGPQESVCAAEDTSMEVDYSSSDKVQ